MGVRHKWQISITGFANDASSRVATATPSSASGLKRLLALQSGKIVWSLPKPLDNFSVAELSFICAASTLEGNAPRYLELSARAVVSLKQQTGIRLPHRRLVHPRPGLSDTAMPRLPGSLHQRVTGLLFSSFRHLLRLTWLHRLCVQQGCN
jgi:hypothetical protein